MLSRSHIELSQAAEKCYTFWHWLFADYYQLLVVRYTLYAEVRRERETLAKLTDAELRDIGVHRADADAESKRSLFDVPADRVDLYTGLHDSEIRREM